MAKSKRTVSAKLLTFKDESILNICEQISNQISELIILERKDDKKFISEYGKIHFSRDAGTGRGAGKLQRDALCTRGRTDLSPFSNRNFRWHPLVVAAESISYAKEIDEIEIDNIDGKNSLKFIIGDHYFLSSEVHNLSERFVALPKLS